MAGYPGNQGPGFFGGGAPGGGTPQVGAHIANPYAQVPQQQPPGPPQTAQVSNPYGAPQGPPGGYGGPPQGQQGGGYGSPPGPPPQQHRPPSTSMSRDDGSWNCSMCTLENHRNAVACAACNSPKPGGGAPMPQQQPLPQQHQPQQQGGGQTFSNCDLRGKSLTGATLRKVDVYDCFLSRCVIEEADLYKCTLTNCTTSKVDIKGKVTLNGGSLSMGSIKGGSINNCGGTVTNVDGYRGGSGAPPPQQQPYGGGGGAYPQQQPQQQQAAGGLYQVTCNKCQGVLMAERSWPETTCPHCRQVIKLQAQGQAPMAQPVGGYGAPGGGGGGVVSVQPQQAPPRRPPPALTGRKRAVLIGINYPGTRAALHGCVNDVRRMQQMLQRRGWKQQDMMVLHDEQHDRSKRPTKANIMNGLQWLTAGVQPGDILFFHYSGHGAQKPDPHGLEEDGMNETILPEDFQRSGMISDDEIFNIVVRPLPDGARLTAIMDCCHSGTGLDLPLTWMGRGRGWKEDTNPFHTLGDVVLFSGCQDDQTSADAADAYSRPAGAMTTAFCDVLERESAPSYCDLLDRMLNSLRQKRFSQRPSMSSTQPFDAQQRLFLLEEICPNMNPTVGRIVRKKFAPRPRQMSRDSPLGMMLGGGMGLFGGLMLADMFF
eukprot:Hpha_TRINITY_DN15280_c1_g7::TRINITY_DN15280_c1_g7_i1::g.67763::m.67763